MRSDPEVAWVGMTEIEAKANGIKYGKGDLRFMHSLMGEHRLVDDISNGKNMRNIRALQGRGSRDTSETEPGRWPSAAKPIDTVGNCQKLGSNHGCG
jgi:hypothetical protein